MEKLEEERVKLVTRCGKLEEEVRQEAARMCEVSPEVMRKIKDDYLASEEF